MRVSRIHAGLAVAALLAGAVGSASAQGVTRAECEANALRAYNTGIQRCGSLSWWAQPSCWAYERNLYDQQMGYCAKIPAGKGSAAVPTSRPNWIDGWF